MNRSTRLHRSVRVYVLFYTMWNNLKSVQLSSVANVTQETMTDSEGWWTRSAALVTEERKEKRKKVLDIHCTVLCILCTVISYTIKIARKCQQKKKKNPWKEKKKIDPKAVKVLYFFYFFFFFLYGTIIYKIPFSNTTVCNHIL